MNFAVTAIGRCEDPYVQVGACALNLDNSVAATGYNGPPSDVEIDWTDRELRRKFIIHAEVNCLNRVLPGQCSILATTVMPCISCLQTIAAKKIFTVCYHKPVPPTYNIDEILEVAAKFKINLRQVDPST